MIELPESHVLANQVNAQLAGKTILQATANESPHKFAWFTGDPKQYADRLGGKTMTRATASGGMLEILAGDILLVFSDGTCLRYFPAAETRPARHQLLLEFSDRSALICSIRMYGSLWALAEGQTEKYHEIARSKPSPYHESFSLSYFRSLYDGQEKRLSAKAFLATKQRIPGFGNGVLQDILFRAGIHPRRQVSTFSDREWQALYQVLKDTLQEMKEKGGRDTEPDLYGRMGRYQTLMGSKTAGRPCTVCGEPIVKAAYMGGSVYFCPSCQKPDL